ncbi:MAG: hypothetical protein JXX29_11900 [Deltaproteobacteria bacterium]|nr:hypothetical protein [Deltaproteobacteria bacterium]MBN2672377.1 hypothetical protein [Deltaproteobacteria bacterium]
MTATDNYILFLDLDGVLVDFEKGVETLFHKPIDTIPPKQLWPRLARTPDFYNQLDWMPDGRVLWEACKKNSPVILTGLPIGKWAEPQKRHWCERELGPDVEVLTCLSRNKAKVARARDTERIPVLVDDREKLKAPFEEMGGVFIHHRSAQQSIEALSALGL